MMLARAFRMTCQPGQHPKEPIAAEKRKHTDIQPREKLNLEEFIKIRPLRGTRMVLQKIFTAKVNYILPYISYA